MYLDLFSGTLFFIIFSSILWWLTRRPIGLPPGPPLLPFVGNMLSMDSDPRVTFRKLRTLYGDIFSIYICHQPIIVLNGYKVLKEALVKNADVFSDRPHSFITDHIAKGRGIVSTSGVTWREQRRFTLSALRDLGMGKSVLEDRIQQEITIFLKELEHENGQAFDCRSILSNAISNIISQTAFGKRFDYSDPFFQRFLNAIQENFAKIGSSNILNILPIVRYLPGDLFNYRTIIGNVNLVNNELLIPNIQEHTENHDDNNTDDVISAYIKEMRHRQQHGDITTMDNENLERVIADLFVAGTETTSTAIRWTLVFFLNYPDVQEKCFQEIKENIGLNRSPSMKDKTSLPYLEATINEVLRLGNIVPTSVPHAVSEDFQFQGYRFPKGVTVIPMLESVLHDPEVWGDPQNFRPDRFLEENGKLRKAEELIPFSLGKRVCLGESLARIELFLFLASMIQRFQFLPEKGNMPSMEGVFGISHSPKPFNMIARQRE